MYALPKTFVLSCCFLIGERSEPLSRVFNDQLRDISNSYTMGSRGISE